MKSLNDYEKQDLLEQFLELTASEFDLGASAASVFEPRDYQLPVLEALRLGIKRVCLCWHRRAGKDLIMLNWINECIQKSGGIFFHLLPTYAQAKKIVWDGLTKDKRRFLSYFTKGSIARVNESELKIVFKDGSIYQLIGTDNYNSILGTNPSGLAFSEYALQNPEAWKLLSPILAENRGWAIFASTPRGKNHFWELFESVKSDPGWFCERLTIGDTKRPSGEPVISEEEIRREIRQGVMDEETAQQEYFCSWTSPMSGAYYARLLEQAEKDGRITRVPYEARYPVQTFWDIGIGDSTSVWFFQIIGREVHVIDYYENRGHGIDHYAKVLREKPYSYESLNLPFDADAKELGTGKSIKDILWDLNVGPVDIVPRLSIEQGIQAVRAIIPKCWFDREKCKDGLRALQNYRSEYDDKRRAFSNNPLHDWSSHAADAFRYFAVGFRERNISPGPSHYQTEFDPLAPNYGARPDQFLSDLKFLGSHHNSMDEWDPFQ
jgi:phage terminase large subunit